MAHEQRYYGEFEVEPEIFSLQQQQQNNGGGAGLWATDIAGASSSEPRMMVDDSSLRCLFPGESSRGLSLSLCNTEPAAASHPVTAGLHQSFFKMQSIHQQQQQQMMMMQEGRFFPSQISGQQPLPPLQQLMLRSSKYLSPAQELLNEFCNLGGSGRNTPKQKKNSSQWEEGGPSSLYTLDLLDLQKRKTKLLSMLEEVDRRYRKYCEQMRAVVASFEAIAGEGAATVYSAMASKAMSRHFRCLRDGIVSQIRATKKAMSEKDPVAPGTTKGETPRLKLLDQCLRQQKAFQQAGMMESHPWRPQRGLPERSVSMLRAWLFEHFLHPYPSDVDKHILARQTGLSRSQVSNWFINARVRLWKPMVEEMYVEEVKEEDDQSCNPLIGKEDSSVGNPNSNPNPNLNARSLSEDQKPAPGELLHDYDSLSSIINSSHRRDRGDAAVLRAESFGVVDLDFSSYNECGASNGGRGVSLTLGLQQHDNRGGVGLAFSPSVQHQLFFSRENMEDCQPVQFSILDGEGQNLPYRNLMGAQLLHDLAG